jgi:WD40 repeat protein/serine/threonine protein kinase
MSDYPDSDADPFGEIAEEFVEAFREGKRPSIDEFARRYPDHAERIRDVLPALVLMEKAKPAAGPAGERPKAPAAAPPLRQLGDYHILREVGRGGMGVVYEAEQVSLGRHVALKVLPSHALLDPRHLSRFQREARAAARLHHTNIVPVFGVGEQDGVHYYVMQFINGLGLDAVLDELKKQRHAPGHRPQTRLAVVGGATRHESAAGVARALLSGTFARPAPVGSGPIHRAGGGDRGPDAVPRPHECGHYQPTPGLSATIHLPGQPEQSSLSDSGRPYWQSIARIGVQVADALAYAFNQGILHRDIKPSNLLLDDRGNVWVTDFGLAKADSDTDALTQTGDLVGTMRYMAPERFSGQGDVRSDVYALGLTLYELLTLRPAFEDLDRNQLIKRILHDDPVRPRKLNRAVPADLETIVLKAVARDPDHRYQTPAAMAEDLQRFIEDRPIRARRVGEAEKFWRWCRRNPLPASLLGALVGVFLVAFVAVSWQLFRVEHEREAKETQRQEADAARVQAQQERDRAATTLYYSQLARARLEFQANNVADARRILDLCDQRRRGWEWQLLREVCHSELLTLEGNTGWICAVAYSSDGKLIASAGTGNPFYDNGSNLVQPGEIILWDAESGRPLRTLRGHQHNLISATFSPDGKRLASCSLDRTVRLWDVASARALQVLPVQGLDGRGVAFSPDGRQLAAGTGDGRVLRWDAGSGAALAPLPCGQRGIWSVVYSPDGKWLAAQRNNGEIVVLDGKIGTPVAMIAASNWDDHVGAPVIAPDSHTLAAPSGSRAIGLWEIPRGKFRRVLTGHQGRINGLAFSPDGDYLASTSDDTTVRVWNLAQQGDAFDHPRVLRGHIDRATVVAFSPDSQRLVSGGRDGIVRVWDLTRDPEHGDLFNIVGNDDLSQAEAVGFADGGRDLLVIGRGGSLVKLESGTHTLREHLSLPLTHTWLTPGHLACTDAAGRRLAGIRGEGRADRERKTALCWDLDTGRELLALHGHTVPLWHVTISADGRRIATAGFGSPPDGLVGEVRVWDSSDGQVLFEMRQAGMRPQRLALSPDGALLAFAAASAQLLPGTRDRAWGPPS